MGATISCFVPGTCTAKDLAALGPTEEAVDRAISLLVAEPKKLLAHNIGDSNTLLHELAIRGNLPMLQATVEAARRSSNALMASGFLYHHGRTVKASTVPCIHSQTRDVHCASDVFTHVINMLNDKHQTPLVEAAMHNRADCVKYLLSEGADPWVADRCGGRTALHYACLGGFTDCVKALLDHVPADATNSSNTRYVNCRTDCGYTPLHFAVVAGRTEVARLLLGTYGADLNIRSSIQSFEQLLWQHPAGTTALHIVAARGDHQMAMELLDHFAWRCVTGGSPLDASDLLDPRLLRDRMNHLPFHVAAIHKHPGLAQALRPTVQVVHRGATGDGDDSGEMLGPARLAVLAGRALRQKLLDELEHASRELAEQQGAALAASSDEASTSTSAPTKVLSSDEEGAVCGICLDSPESVAMCCPSARPQACGASGCGGCTSAYVKAGCGHGLCLGCAKQLCALPGDIMGCSKPALCPFCRTAIPGFAAGAAAIKL